MWGGLRAWLSRRLLVSQSWYASKRLMANRKRLVRLLACMERVDRRLRGRRKVLQKELRRLDQTRRRVESISKVTLEDIEGCERLQKRYENALDAARQQLQVLQDVTIPQLAAESSRQLARLDLETAIDKHRQGMLTQGHNPPGGW